MNINKNLLILIWVEIKTITKESSVMIAIWKYKCLLDIKSGIKNWKYQHELVNKRALKKIFLFFKKRRGEVKKIPAAKMSIDIIAAENNWVSFPSPRFWIKK